MVPAQELRSGSVTPRQRGSTDPVLNRKTAINTLISRVLFGGTSRLRDYEKRCIGWVSERMSPTAAGVLGQQVGGVMTLQRFSADKLVLFGSLQRQVDIPAFANLSSDVTFANIGFASGTSKKWRCVLTCANGRLSTLEFSQPPRELSASSMQLIECTVLLDMMEPITVASVEARASSGPLIESIRRVAEVSEVKPPATDRDIESFRTLLDANIPDDFGRLAHEANGFRADEWQFYGTAGRRVILPGANYAYLAESDIRALAIREGNETSELYLHDEIDDEFTPLGPSFVDAFIGVLQRNFDEE